METTALENTIVFGHSLESVTFSLKKVWDTSFYIICILFLNRAKKLGPKVKKNAKTNIKVNANLLFAEY